MSATKDPNNPGKPPEQPPKKLKRHVEFRELTVDEIKRARDEGAYLMGASGFLVGENQAQAHGCQPGVRHNTPRPSGAVSMQSKVATMCPPPGDAVFLVGCPAGMASFRSQLPCVFCGLCS
jgi:hypothetical protein